MSRIIERLKHQWVLKLLSVALAISLWAYVHVRESSPVRKEIQAPVACINIPQDLVVLSTQPDEIGVTLQSQRGSLTDSVLRNIRLVADLSGAQIGQQRVPVELYGVPSDVTPILYERLVTVTLDERVRARRPVIVEVLGIPAEGYSAQSAQVQPDEVTISGPSGVVRAVERVVAVADVSGYSATAELQVTVEARDERNVVVSGVQFQPTQVTVIVPVTKLTTRTVLVKPNLSEPPPGYQITTAQTSPNTVAIAGNADVVEQIEYLSTTRINISELRGKQTFTVDIGFPQGITSMGVGAVSVTVTVKELPAPPEEPEEEATTPEKPIPAGEGPAVEPENEDSGIVEPTPAEPDNAGPSPE